MRRFRLQRERQGFRPLCAHANDRGSDFEGLLACRYRIHAGRYAGESETARRVALRFRDRLARAVLKFDRRALNRTPERVGDRPGYCLPGSRLR